MSELKCEHEGCEAVAYPCYADGDEPAAWYCAEHLHLHGYCWQDDREFGDGFGYESYEDWDLQP